MVFYQLLVRGSALLVLGGDISKFLLEKKKKKTTKDTNQYLLINTSEMADWSHQDLKFTWFDLAWTVPINHSYITTK